MSYSYTKTLPAVQPFLAQYNHFDEKMIVGTVTLREFVAGALSYQPWWLKALYGVRGVFVRLLGMRQPLTGGLPVVQPSAVSFERGSAASFFTVQGGVEDQFIVLEATDKHLTAQAIISVEPLPNGANRFYLATVVYHHHWTGPVYFNVIRPFHHLVAWCMMVAGVRQYAE